jgi:hypothetical protein
MTMKRKELQAKLEALFPVCHSRPDRESIKINSNVYFQTTADDMKKREGIKPSLLYFY